MPGTEQLCYKDLASRAGSWDLELNESKRVWNGRCIVIQFSPNIFYLYLFCSVCAHLFVIAEVSTSEFTK